MPKNVFAYRYGHLPKVKKKIEGVLKKLKLQPVYKKHTVDKFLRQEKRFYMPPVVHQTSDKKYFFKARLQNTDEVLHTGLKEIRFHKRIKKTAERFRSTVIIPEYEKAGVEKNGFIWFLREYLEGKFAGQSRGDHAGRESGAPCPGRSIAPKALNPPSGGLVSC